MTKEYIIFVMSVRGKALIDEREALMKNLERLHKEIKNGKDKPGDWHKSKRDKLFRVWDRYCEVNDLIVQCRTTRNRVSSNV